LVQAGKFLKFTYFNALDPEVNDLKESLDQARVEYL